MMLDHHIKIAIRNIKKQGWFAVINIAGLSIGVALSVMILLLVKYELTYDSFYTDSDLIYRTVTKGVIGGDVINGAPTPMPLAKLIKSYDEVDKVTRIYLGSNKLISYDEKKFGEERFFFGDEDFFAVFDLPLVAGALDLTKPGNIVITQSIARKYFGYTDPIGKVIIRENYQFNVVGICEDVPDASHFHFDFMASMATVNKILQQKGDSTLVNSWYDDWLDLKCYTYLKFHNDVDINEFEQRLNKGKERYISAQLKDYLEADKYKKIMMDFYLQPIQDIHLHSQLDNELEPNSSQIFVNILVFAAILILLITCFNFVNLTTSKASDRFRESGLRKLIGASRTQLIIQFLCEAILYSISAMFIGLVLLELTLPLLNAFFSINISFFRVNGIKDLAWILFIVLIVAILIGSYPAFFFSGKRSDVVLVGGDKRIGKSGYILRGIFVSCQIAVTVYFMVMTTGMWGQIRYIHSVDLGFNPENIIVVKRASTLGHRIKPFKNALKNTAGVENVTGCWNIPGDELSVTPFELNTNGKSNVVKLSYIIVDNDYFETMELSLKAGRFLGGSLADTMGILLNEQAVRELQIKKPLGERLGFLGVKDWDMTVVGVLKDFHFQSLHHKMEPMAVFMTPNYEKHPYLLIKFNEAITEDKLTFIEEIWHRFTDDSPFEWELLEDRLSTLYNEDSRIAKLTTVIALLALFMTILGIVALSAFISEFKARSIGIKKMLGASRQTIMLNVFSVFGVYVVAGILASALPLYITISEWGKRFAYMETINMAYFLLIALFMGSVVFVAVFYQVYKVASDKPLDVWQYE